MITGAGLLEETGAVSSASADAPAVVVAGALVEGASEAASCGIFRLVDEYRILVY